MSAHTAFVQELMPVPLDEPWPDELPKDDGVNVSPCVSAHNASVQLPAIMVAFAACGVAGRESSGGRVGSGMKGN